MKIAITLDEATSSEQNKLISSLEDTLKAVEGVSDTNVKKVREDSQDAGTILSIVLAGPAVVLAVKAMNNWLIRKNQASLSLTMADGTTLKVTALDSNDVPNVVAAIQAGSVSS